MKKVVLIILLLFPFSVFADKTKVEFFKCVDGDTARFVMNKKEVKIVHEKQHHKKDIVKYDNKKDITIVKVYNEPQKKHHHHKHHNKVYYSSNDDFAAKCLGTGLCLIMLSAIAG